MRVGEKRERERERERERKREREKSILQLIQLVRLLGSLSYNMPNPGNVYQ